MMAFLVKMVIVQSVFSGVSISGFWGLNKAIFPQQKVYSSPISDKNARQLNALDPELSSSSSKCFKLNRIDR